MRGITILKADQNHLNQILELERKIFESEDRFSRARLRYLLRSRNAEFFLSLKDQSPIGYGIALKNKLRNRKIKGRIYSLGVLRQHRDQGVGSQLLDSMEKWLGSQRASFITLETKASRAGAKDYFARKGYEVTEYLPDYYSQADGLRMRKSSPSLPVRTARTQPVALQS